jgi:hypothetical protein
MRDRDVRAAVLKTLAAQHAGDAETRIVQEMGVWSGTVRIDIAVINGELCGYELKSEKDTLARLPMQLRIYSKVFDRVVLVTGLRHVGHAQDRIPSWWGLTIARGEADSVRLDLARPPQLNPSPDPYLVAQLLWKDEALTVLDTFGLAKGWRAKRTKLIHQRLATELPFAQLSEQVRNALKRRDAWLGQQMPRKLDVPIDADCDPSL